MLRRATPLISFMFSCIHKAETMKNLFSFSSLGTWKVVAKYQNSPNESFSTQFEIKEYGRKEKHPCAGLSLPDSQLHSYKSLGSSLGKTLCFPTFIFSTGKTPIQSLLQDR